MFSPLSKAVSIPLDDGSTIDFTLRELSIAQTEEYFRQLLIVAAQYYEAVNGQQSQAMLEDLAEGLEARPEYLEILQGNERLWQMVTGRDNVMWLGHTYASVLPGLLTEFEAVNPLVGQKKTALQRLLTA